MKNTTNTEVDNLVMFPASKNFSLENPGHDPLEELLEEFSDLLDEDFADELEMMELEENEDEMDQAAIYGSLEEYMNRNKMKANLSMVNAIVDADINSYKQTIKLKEIQAMQEKIKFYLDDLEMFLPKRN